MARHVLLRLRVDWVRALSAQPGWMLYSWGLRLFLMVAAVAAGIVHPLAMLPVTLLLLVALHDFDRPAGRAVDVARSTAGGRQDTL